MKALLMHPDREFDLQQGLPWNAQALTEDLELETLLRAMAGDDAFLLDVARKALLAGFRNDIDTIVYRQDVLKDCLMNPEVARTLYAIANEAFERKSGHWLGVSSRFVGGILYEGIELMQFLAGILVKLRDIAREHAHRFDSTGFTALFAMLERELSDAYFASIQNHLNDLQFRRGVPMSAELSEGNAGGNYVLRSTPARGPNWLARFLGKAPPAYAFYIHPRDEAGARYLSELRDRGLNLVANALAQSTDHILSFFQMMRMELAFYIGCMNVKDRLAEKDEPVCFPNPEPAGRRILRFTGLYDACLALAMARKVVGNTTDADGMSLVVLTGANQGGKSTFLRSIGLAQTMMQSGMFVAAETFSADLCAGLFTHFKREEDAAMTHGKFDEELARMSDIADHLTPHAILLFNESFASTNEREGSEIARQIVCALRESGVKIFFVTHMIELARTLCNKRLEDALFLRAERLADGTRTFHLAEGEPLETSYGEDLYRQVFVIDAERNPA